MIWAVGWFKNVRQKSRNAASSGAYEELTPIKLLGRLMKAFEPLNEAIHYCANCETGNQMFFCTRHNLISVECSPSTANIFARLRQARRGKVWGHLACLFWPDTPDANSYFCDMTPNLKRDLENLSRLAFRRAEKGHQLVQEFCSLNKRAQNHPDYTSLEEFYPWLLVPLTLWPIDLNGLGHHLLKLVKSGLRLDPKTKLLLAQLGSPPPASTQTVVAQQEHQVQLGNYEPLIKQQHKFDAMEKELGQNPEFNASWHAIKARFDVTRYQNHKKLIRRRMVQERNFRSDWEFRWHRNAHQFQVVFDAFCHRWNLYGMECDKPLLLKLTVNLTPYGTMIVVPSYWSFDAKRDLKWKAIKALHRARCVSRQGPKLDAIKQARREDSKRVKSLWQKSKTLGLKGDARMRWVLEQHGWHPGSDESKVKRLLRLK